MKPDRQDNKNGSGPNNSKKNLTGFLFIVLWAVVIFFGIRLFASSLSGGSSAVVPYSTFREWVSEGYVDTVHVSSDRFTFTLRENVKVETGKDGEYILSWATEEAQPVEPTTSPEPQESFTPEEEALAELLEAYSEGLSRSSVPVSFVTVPTISVEGLMDMLDENGVTYYEDPVDAGSVMIQSILSYVLPILIMVLAMALLYRWLFSKMGSGGMGGLGGVGKANAKVYVEKKTGVTFKDVAGQDEAKESLVEIIDFLHNPQKYTDIGAKLPKGALLVGPPGTGKTLLAKAVAGEANVPFFSISGSDFVEMFVGVGASRVRDLFKEANKMAPCIVFIDEIDTIGKSRDNRMGGNDEREQTLNQLLAEMDGFDPTKGVILLAATNRPEVLDQALLRPGRFDRRIIVDRPNLAGRLATLQVHTRKIKLAEDVDLKKVALATAGCVGADLANLVNEAALRAVRMGRKAVNQADLLAAFELVIAGTEKKGSVLTEFEKKLVAYHEVGHAMVAYKQKNTEPVQKITIVPHTQGSLGYTLLMPEEDKTELRTKDELMAKIAVSMGGRAAEEVVMNTMTNGASQDIQDATNIARNMVAMFGMSEEFGMMALASRRNQYLDGGYGMDCAQDTAARMDQAVKEILDQCYQQAVEVIKANREDMDKVVAYLLEKETITGAEMVAILEGRDPATAEDYLSTPEEKPAPAAGETSGTGESVIPLPETLRTPPADPPSAGDQPPQDGGSTQ